MEGNSSNKTYKIVLVRHGESIWNKENRFTGWTDVDLSEVGVKEAIEAGERLKDWKFDVVHASVLKRAIKTWNGIADAMRDAIRAQFHKDGYLPWGVGPNAPAMASPDFTGYVSTATTS